MAALVSLFYHPNTTLFTMNKAHIRPRIPVTRCSVRVSSSSRRIRRKNYLRPKILKTLTNPYSDPVPNLIDGGLETRVEEDVAVEELETVNGVDEGGLREVEIVRDGKGVNLIGFNGRMVFKVVGSFMGLFVLQTVVSVWLMGGGDSGEKDRRVGSEGWYGKEVGLNGSVVVGDGGVWNVDELKIAEIKRMAREVREAEKKKRDMEKGEEDLGDESDNEEDYEADGSVKNENDERLTMLRKMSSIPVKNVNYLNKVVGFGEEVKKENVNGKEDDNRLMFEAKRKFRSHMTESGEKPKGFAGVGDVRMKGMNINGAKSESGNTGTENPVSNSSTPSASEEKNLVKGINGSSSFRSDSSINGLDNGINKGAKSESGSQKKMNDQNVSKSKMDPLSRRNGKSDSGKLKSNLSRSTNKDKNNNDDRDHWWSCLPCVFVILMQRGRGSDVEQRFYTLRINSDNCTVAFEDQTDARNFTYILDSFFEDFPDTAVDFDLMTTKDLKEMIELENQKVVVVRKGKLKLYAGQPLADAESAMRLLVE